MMQKPSIFTRVLVVVGSVLAWLPLAAPFVLTAIRLAGGGSLLFDYLMPAELFPVALMGGFLLLWAAVRMRTRTALLAWGMSGMLVGLVGTQVAAVLTGLASGDAEPEGWRLVVVLALLALYTLALVSVAVGGILLARHSRGRELHTSEEMAVPGDE